MAVKDLVNALNGSSTSSVPSAAQTAPELTASKFKNDPEKIAELQKMLDDIKNQRMSFERQWYLNLAFYFGKQYVIWATAGVAQRLVEPPAPDHRVRIVVNKCRVVVRKEMSKLLKERPRGFVVPSTSDDSDKAAARGAAKLYESMEKPDALALQKKMRQAMFWVSTCGNGFKKIYYDPDKLDFTGVKGSIEVEAINPFAIYVPDLLECDIQNQPFVIHQTSRPVEWVKQTFGIEPTPDSSSSTAGIDQRFINSLGINQEITNKKYVSIKEVWMKPCPKYPNGLMATWYDKHLLQWKEEFPYKHGRYPFVKIDHVPTGRFYNDSILPDFIPIQREYNRSMSQLMEIRNTISKPQWVVSKGSVDASMMTSAPGLVIPYLPGTPKPEQVQPVPLPSYVMQIIDRMLEDMNDVSAQHEVSHAGTPTGVTAATALSFLQEEDDSSLALTITSIEEAAQEVGRQVLSLVSQYWSVSRSVKITGNSNGFEVKKFSQASLKGSTDYRVEYGSAIPRSRAAKQAFLLELRDRQAIPNDEFLHRLDMAETSELYEDSQRDIRAAEREDMQMLDDSKVMDINDYDNHLVHIVTHRKFQNSEEFMRLDDKEKQPIIDHVKIHVAHVAAMYGRPDLIPTVILDPSTQQPIIDQVTGKPKMTPENPALEGFIEMVILHGPPPLPPPPMAPGQEPQGAPNAAQSQSSQSQQP